jgi:hypothetical protein
MRKYGTDQGIWSKNDSQRRHGYMRHTLGAVMIEEGLPDLTDRQARRVFVCQAEQDFGAAVSADDGRTLPSSSKVTRS